VSPPVWHAKRNRRNRMCYKTPLSLSDFSAFLCYLLDNFTIRNHWHSSTIRTSHQHKASPQISTEGKTHLILQPNFTCTSPHARFSFKKLNLGTKKKNAMHFKKPLHNAKKIRNFTQE
jgi:hypothetical protein